MKHLLFCVLFTAFIAVGATDARAATILPNCATCGSHNTTWDLTLALIDDANNIYQLTARATYGAPVDFAFVNAIAYKVDPFTNQYDANPTVTGPAEDTWNVGGGGISAGGCSGSGNGFFCANSSGFGASHGAAGTTDTWVFLINISNSLPNLAGAITGSFKAQFINNGDSGKVGSLISEDVTFTFDSPPPPDVNTPEPATLLMFGTGLAAVATAIRRRKKAR